MLNRAPTPLDTDLNATPESEVKPERNLLAAILARAICDAFGSAHCERHHVRSARQWIFTKINVKKPFAFGWVAQHLNIDPAMLQKMLRDNQNDPESMDRMINVLRS